MEWTSENSQKFKGVVIPLKNRQVIDLTKNKKFQDVRILQDDIISLEEGRKVKEEEDVPTNDFVTNKQLSDLEDKLELRVKVAVQPLESKIDSLQTTLNGKFETMEEKIKNLFLEQKIELQKERKENIKWIVGTGIAIVSAMIAYFSVF